MLESIALLIVSNQFFSDENQYKVCKFLSNQLHNIRFTVEKISFVQEDENIVTNEIKLLSKEYDFVIVVDAGLKRKLIFNSLSNVCNGKSINPSELTNNFNNHIHEDYDEQSSRFPKILKLDTQKQNVGVLYYFQRIFIMNSQEVEILFQDLMNHLLQYQKEAKYKKMLQVFISEITSDKSLEIIDGLVIKKNDDVAIIQLEKTDFESFVEIELLLRKEISDKVIEICDNDLISKEILNCKEDHMVEAIQVS